MDLDKTAEFHKALSLTVRLEILKFLLKEPCCICHISKHINKDQSVTFRHIQILKNVGLVETYKEKSFLYCKIVNKEEVEGIIG